MHAQVLNEQQLSQLQTNWEDARIGKKYEFRAAFVRRYISPKTDSAKIKNYIGSGQVPFRITGSFYEFIKSGAGYKKAVLRDTAHVYIMDSKENVIFQKTRSVCDLEGS